MQWEVLNAIVGNGIYDNHDKPFLDVGVTIILDRIVCFLEVVRCYNWSCVYAIYIMT